MAAHTGTRKMKSMHMSGHQSGHNSQQVNAGTQMSVSGGLSIGRTSSGEKGIFGISAKTTDEIVREIF